MVVPNFAHVPRLFGREDPFHFHKLMGFTTTLHFIYRVFHPDWDMGFQPRDPWMFAGLLSHTALSGSSLVFHIPTNRVKGAPMIWPEFRLHSILFAYRSLAILFAFWVSPTTLIWMRPLSVLGTLMAADLVSHHYKKQGLLRPDQTTMRSMPFPAWVSPRQIQWINMYYSISQVYATMNMLFGPPSSVFLTLFPIQFAAFWMTLVRKGILTAGLWHSYYALSLASNYLYGALRPSIPGSISSIYYNIFAGLFIMGRFHYKMNKYYLWCCIIFCSYFIE